jgi:hypothetical protein
MNIRRPQTSSPKKLTTESNAHYEKLRPVKSHKIKFATLLKNKRIWYFFGFIALCLSLFLGSYLGTQKNQFATKKSSNSTTSQSGTVQGNLSKGTPDYKTILPNGKSIESLGGWTKVSPPTHSPVFAYVDTLGKATLTVSQQPLPETFKDDPANALEELASGYNATQKLVVEDQTAYVGLSSKGPQSIIFTKNNLLILIKTNIPLTNDQITSYIISLS